LHALTGGGVLDPVSTCASGAPGGGFDLG